VVKTSGFADMITRKLRLFFKFSKLCTARRCNRH